MDGEYAASPMRRHPTRPRATAASVGCNTVRHATHRLRPRPRRRHHHLHQRLLLQQHGSVSDCVSRQHATRRTAGAEVGLHRGTPCTSPSAVPTPKPPSVTKSIQSLSRWRCPEARPPRSARRRVLVTLEAACQHWRGPNCSAPHSWRTPIVGSSPGIAIPTHHLHQRRQQQLHIRAGPYARQGSSHKAKATGGNS